jgi:hypothetical protein
MLPSLELSRLPADKEFKEQGVARGLPLWRTLRVTWRFVGYAKLTVVPVRRLIFDLDIRKPKVDDVPR